MNTKQQTFCELYATSRDHFGNGTQSYIDAYGIDTSKKGAYQSAATCAGRLLNNVEVLDKIHSLMSLGSLTNEYVDKQLAFLITQNADLGVKIRAISEYNKVRGRVIKKTEVSNQPTSIEDVIARLEKAERDSGLA